jgi:hypothetical protein
VLNLEARASLSCLSLVPRLSLLPSFSIARSVSISFNFLSLLLRVAGVAFLVGSEEKVLVGSTCF